MHLMRILKTAGKILGISFLCLLVIGFITGIFYGKEIKQLILAELNKNLDTKIHVEEFNFSLLSHFPYASFEMKNVVVEEVSTSEKKDTLLFSSRLSLLFNIIDVFKKDISVKKVLVNNGTINIRIDEAGHGNYHFWKKSSDTTEAGVIDIEKIVLKNVNLKYIDKKDNQDYSMLAYNANLSGKFSGNEFSLKTKADFLIYKLLIHGENYVNNKPVSLSSGLIVNSKTASYKFDNTLVKIAGVDFNFGGQITNESSEWLLNLAIKSNEADIKKLTGILPDNYKKYFGRYNASGNILFNTSIQGSIEGKKTPLVKVEFSVNNGSLIAGDAKIEKLLFSGSFVNQVNSKKSTLNIPSLTASLSGHAIQASIRLDDLPDAFLSLQAKTQLNLKEIQPFIQSDTLESLSGDLAMNISYAGKVRELSALSRGQLYNIKASGNIDISHVSFKLRKNPLEFNNMSGNFSLHNNDIYIKNLSGNISSSDFLIDGVFRNFISFLLIPDQPGDLQAKVVSKTVNLDELLVNKLESNSKDTSYILKFNPRLICELDVNIENINFRRFSAGNIEGKVNLKKQVISGSKLKFNSMGGSVTLDATINASRRDSVTMDYDTKFTNVDVPRLFYEMENFDQQTMTDKNVKGRINADVQFLSKWSNDLTLNSKSVRSTCEITIENGELINFSPILAMGKYIHAPDLNHIRFSTLKNNISIANRKIMIPKMDIHSSAINISGNGVHDFDNNIDYHLQLLLSDVLGSKVKRHTSEFGEIQDDGLGRSKLFLSMRGTVDDPHFSYDRKAAGDKLKTDIAQEKRNLKGMLKQEFGLYKNQPSVQIEKPKKKEEMQIDWSNQ